MRAGGPLRLGIALVALASAAVSARAKGDVGGYPDFEIVESIPVETALDNPAIRDTAEVWLEMVAGAKKTIDLEQFYICDIPGGPLAPVIDAVVAAGERGVRIRVIGEAAFYRKYPDALERLKRSKNIQVRIVDYKKLAGGVQHAKFFVVDREQVFLGSQNFDWRALQHIHEIGVRIRHPEAVRFYSDIFDLDWALAEQNDKTLLEQLKKPVRYKLPIEVTEADGETLQYRPLASPTGWLPDPASWDEPRIVELLDGARREIALQLLIYSPAERGGYFADLDNALRRAAGRGVKVKLIISDWAKRKPTIFHLQSLAALPNIEVKLSTIPQHSGGHVAYARVEHCKYLVVDGEQTWIGTSNWERDYFYASRNVGVIVASRRISTIVRDIFQKGWNGPYTYPVNPAANYQPPRIGD
ncbi:MAG: phospholipase [Deltaproteobacteria bacterium]|nr:phospholipase [Deltaproteobacteria bacterium]